MRLRDRAILAALMLAQACSAERSAAPRDEFRLCSDDPRMRHVIGIDFAALMGRSSDNSFPVSRCADPEPPCIDFPLLISAPPRPPSGPMDEVKWRNGNLRFALRLLTGSASNEDYVLEILMFEPRPGGREAAVGRWLSHYRTDEGLLSFRTLTEPDSWVRCGGRLTFDDVRELTKQLPMNDPLSNILQ
jgi:hypothetical protein